MYNPLRTSHRKALVAGKLLKCSTIVFSVVQNCFIKMALKRAGGTVIVTTTCVLADDIKLTQDVRRFQL